MEKRVTSQDVADLAGVSRTTVSFVLNDIKRFTISPTTREKVIQAARQLGYYPNASARALASNQTKAIGLVMTRDPRYISSDPFLPLILSGLLDAIKQYHLNLLLEWVEHGQQTQTYMKLTKSKRIDGMILMTPRYDDGGLQELEETNFPAVMMGAIPDSNLFSVDIDNTAAAKMAVTHLIALGHQRIACIVNAPAPFSSATQRLRGYQQALEEFNIPLDESLVRFADFDPTSGYTQMKSLLNAPNSLTAVFVASDNVCMGAMAAARDAGLSIPGDLSMVGFDDIALAAYASPTLTTVHLPTREIAQQSCQLLIRLMAGDIPESRSVILPTQLILRRSTRALDPRADLAASDD